MAGVRGSATARPGVSAVGQRCARLKHLSRIIHVGWDEVAQVLGGTAQATPCWFAHRAPEVRPGERPKSHHGLGLLVTLHLGTVGGEAVEEEVGGVELGGGAFVVFQRARVAVARRPAKTRRGMRQLEIDEPPDGGASQREPTWGAGFPLDNQCPLIKMISIANYLSFLPDANRQC
jgi:hypothetical protein